ncbi:MAG TPA: class I fructose-bisphosphate aldolase, partial [Chitinispirillaceae bacterium]|nr:class I fructose-bisphosphate aldolase [Chitinispirillaceae bacterium]
MNPQQTIEKLLSDSKGILAADESFGTIGKRFAKIRTESTPVSRQQYREMLFSTPGIENYISGVILFDETIHQTNSAGIPFAKFLSERNIVPGIKVDKGTNLL